jgi:hypothetical protein
LGFETSTFDKTHPPGEASFASDKRLNYIQNLESHVPSALSQIECVFGKDITKRIGFCMGPIVQDFAISGFICRLSSNWSKPLKMIVSQILDCTLEKQGPER